MAGGQSNSRRRKPARRPDHKAKARQQTRQAQQEQAQAQCLPCHLLDVLFAGRRRKAAAKRSAVRKQEGNGNDDSGASETSQGSDRQVDSGRAASGAAMAQPDELPARESDFGRFVEGAQDAALDRSGHGSTGGESGGGVGAPLSSLDAAARGKERAASAGNGSAANLEHVQGSRIGQYECLSLVGKGSFGRVFLARGPEGRPHAVKVLPKCKLVSRRKQRLVMDEKRVMEECGHHPFILSLECTFQTPEYLCLVTEFCPGGELFFHLEKASRFTEDQVRFYCAEIACALGHLHKHRIAYRDLKSENLLLDSLGHIRLADFGLAAPKVGEWRGARSICGTPAYIAPEMIRQGGRNGTGYGFSVDYWSLGTLMYDVLCGQPPYFRQNMELMCEAILSRPLTFPANVRLSPEAKDIIRRLLRRNPEARLGSSHEGGLAGIQGHAFFKTIDWGSLEAASTQRAPVQLQTASSVADNGFDTRNFHRDFTSSPVRENLRIKEPPRRARSHAPPARAQSKGWSRQDLAGHDRRARSSASNYRPVAQFPDWDYVRPVRPPLRQQQHQQQPVQLA